MCVPHAHLEVRAQHLVLLFASHLARDRASHVSTRVPSSLADKLWGGYLVSTFYLTGRDAGIIEMCDHVKLSPGF